MNLLFPGIVLCGVYACSAHKAMHIFIVHTTLAAIFLICEEASFFCVPEQFFTRFSTRAKYWSCQYYTCRHSVDVLPFFTGEQKHLESQVRQNFTFSSPFIYILFPLFISSSSQPSRIKYSVQDMSQLHYSPGFRLLHSPLLKSIQCIKHIGRRITRVPHWGSPGPAGAI